MYSDWTLTNGLCPGVEQDVTWWLPAGPPRTPRGNRHQATPEQSINLHTSMLVHTTHASRCTHVAGRHAHKSHPTHDTALETAKTARPTHVVSPARQRIASRVNRTACKMQQKQHKGAVHAWRPPLQPTSELAAQIVYARMHAFTCRWASEIVHLISCSRRRPTVAHTRASCLNIRITAETCPRPARTPPCVPTPRPFPISPHHPRQRRERTGVGEGRRTWAHAPHAHSHQIHSHQMPHARVLWELDGAVSRRRRAASSRSFVAVIAHPRRRPCRRRPRPR